MKGLGCRIGAFAPDPDPGAIPRKHRRSMSRMSQFTVLACREALEQARVDSGLLGSGRVGLAVGATVGSPETFQEFFTDYLREYSLESVKSQIFFKVMGHSCASNAALALGIAGRVLAPSAACASAGQAMGLGYEAIAMGRQDIMICGGAEELHSTHHGAPSTSSTPHPADTTTAPMLRQGPLTRTATALSAERGAGVLVLESLDSARARGAPPLAEILGVSMLTDASNISSPSSESIEACMRQALDDAGIRPGDVDYVNAHATGTEIGDMAEGLAVERVFGDRPLVSGCKGNLGHCLAASGGLECAALVQMMAHGRVTATLNLDIIDPRCGNIRHVTSAVEHDISVALKNSFALGGANTSLVMASPGRVEFST